MNICVTDILCCTPKSNTTLQINYTPIKFLTPTPQNNNKVKWKNKTLKTNQTAEKPYAWRASVVNSTQTLFKKNLNTPQFILLGITLILKSDRHTRKEKYRSISPREIDVKILNKM